MGNTLLQLTQLPNMQTQMLIRRPAEDVFAAFIDPGITTKFWFTKSSAPLQTGANVTWEWEMYNASANVHVVSVEPNSRITIEWGTEQAGLTQVEWRFAPYGNAATLVTITEQGFTGTADEAVAKVLDAMGGFSFLLAGAKAWLEHGIALKLVEDHAPSSV